MLRSRYRYGLIPLLLAMVGLVGSIAGCSGTGKVAPVVPTSPVSLYSLDDWTQFAHDASRSAVDSASTELTAASVAGLQMRWNYHSSDGIKASLLVSGQRVYAFGLGGYVRALDAATGKELWERQLGDGSQALAATPTLADGKLFIGTHAPMSVPPSSSAFYALDANTGSVLWSATVLGAFRSAPLVTQGLVVVGDAGGDPMECNHGGVYAFNESTGQTRWKWQLTSNVADGGSVWAPISFDGQHIIFGSAETCNDPSPLGNALIALNPDGSLAWSHQVENSISDDNFGGASLLVGGRVIAMSKDGYLYVVDRASGTLITRRQLNALDLYGGLSSPSIVGSTLLVGSGYLTDPYVNQVPGGRIYGLDATSLQEKWHIDTSNPVSGYAAISGGGVAFVDLDDHIDALNPTTGTILWSYKLSTYAYASPTVVPSGVYTADTNGNIYAFGLTGSTASASTLARQRNS
jgi:outer membrane protein assembly factor BamB